MEQLSVIDNEVEYFIDSNYPLWFKHYHHEIGIRIYNKLKCNCEGTQIKYDDHYPLSYHQYIYRFFTKENYVKNGPYGNALVVWVSPSVDEDKWRHREIYLKSKGRYIFGIFTGIPTERESVPVRRYLNQIEGMSS